MCSTVLCLTQYLGLGTANYQSSQSLIFTTSTGITYLCNKQTHLYNCTKSTVYTNMDY